MIETLKKVLSQKTTKCAIAAIVLMAIGLADGKVSLDVGINNIVDNLVGLAIAGITAYQLSTKGEK